MILVAAILGLLAVTVPPIITARITAASLKSARDEDREDRAAVARRVVAVADKVQEVHEIVNSARTILLERNAVLEALIVKLGGESPPEVPPIER